MNDSCGSPDAYSQTTHEINVSVYSHYLESQSRPDEQHYFWSYHVRIENRGNIAAQLLTRYWRIVDARGQIYDVIGDGVIGEQPFLQPGDVFEYTSGTPLSSESGFMSGSFRMISAVGEQFDVQVPSFSLDRDNGLPQCFH